MSTTEATKVPGFCGLCIARCGSIASVEDGRFMRLDPDPTHPTGQALCAKGRAAPELVYSKQRLTRPLRRTRPKGEADPGWVEISWDEALDTTAAAMRQLAAAHGAHSVAFSQSSPSTTAIGDSAPFVRRLMNAFGTPNLVWALDLCGWGRGFATRYAFGVASVATGSGGGAMADIANSGCLILWGYNPSYTRLTHATATVEALKHGMKLIVIDPRHVGLAGKADLWLRPRPGTDGALALGLAHVMISRGWYDQAFVRAWTNAPHLVRSDTGRLLRAVDLAEGGGAGHFVAWDGLAGQPVAYDPAIGRYGTPVERLALEGEVMVATKQGMLPCRPVFAHYAQLCARHTPERVAAICWIAPDQVEAAARLLWHSRPVSYYAWSGHEHHANTTETARAMALLYALTGSFDQRGGNVLFPAVPNPVVTGEDLPAARHMAPAVGLESRPLGPAKWNNVSASDFYRAVLEGEPYPVRGLIGFGSNLLLAFSDPLRGRRALAALDFYVHADLFLNPTAELADIVLPVASCFEREALRFGFEISAEAQSLVQLRKPVVPPPGLARSDTDIIFDLAVRLGLGEHFWNGDVEAAYRHQLAPSGLSLEALRAEPRGIRVPLTTRHAKHAEPDPAGHARGFATPSRRVEFWSETMQAKGHAPMPEFVPPPNPDAERYPLVLTCAKPTLFCQTQHRALPSLRRRAMNPQVMLHPETAARRGIASGDWVSVETQAGAMRARALLNAAIDPRVVVGEHGWWQAAPEAGAPGYDPFSALGSNYNLAVDPAARDPISGTTAHRSGCCEVFRTSSMEQGKAADTRVAAQRA
ncbi:molybdopterin oxidoreductase [Rhodopila globiformis]|uniref:Molybdopterin oxidoreductase n=1 Tax=Rhodopila globiformis TaxID=1071 RepID=A0A2S6NNI3_RHOGL|nr:molybdopterin oxidoreductase [Rhodopila globiformis]